MSLVEIRRLSVLQNNNTALRVLVEEGRKASGAVLCFDVFLFRSFHEESVALSLSRSLLRPWHVGGTSISLLSPMARAFGSKAAAWSRFVFLFSSFFSKRDFLVASLLRSCVAFSAFSLRLLISQMKGWALLLIVGFAALCFAQNCGRCPSCVQANNPTFDKQCAVDIVFVLDETGSIRNSGNGPEDVRSGSRSFFSALSQIKAIGGVANIA